MRVRAATADDAGEVVRLAALMYASMGLDVSDPAWIAAAEDAARSRLGDELAVFVVDHPTEPRLIASGAGTIATRLPAPNNHTARVGYVQWIATEPEFRRRGLARQIMEALLAWYEQQGVTAVELHATTDGEPLYRSLGFGDEGARALRRRA
jgi:GNAT superfamily N-acetyltransferase